MMLKRLLRLLLCITLGSSAATVQAAAPIPPKDPVLRIETGSHLSQITRISTDTAGRWVVTASDDKTARLWDARTGQAVAVLRPPIGTGGIGAIYAAGISPDGRTVALGGNSDFDGNSGHLLHLFERSSASVPPKSTLAGIEAPITQLAWSKDSQYLAIGLRQDGLRVFRRNLQIAGTDPEFNEAIFGAEFSADGKLAVASLDGAIRLYQLSPKGLVRVARKMAPGGKPYGVSFSADGRTLAVGYQDQARVDLLDATTLAVVHTNERKGGNLGRVVWSADGSTLFAAGSHTQAGRFPVLAWDQGGRGTAREVGQFSDTVLSLAAMPDGAVAAASAEPAWAIFERAGATRVARRSQGIDFRDAGDQFRISTSAGVVAFWGAQQGEAMVLDLTNASLSATAAPAQVNPPKNRTEASEWKNRGTPRIGGRNVPMLQGELARSLAQAPDERSFVVGSDWFVRHYSAEGGMLWERRVPAAAWAVNISADGRWVVVGLGDGSIRWLRLTDGAEQLTAFVHADRTRWIAWTPSGYYDTSVGGEDLVGWHLNRAFNQSADFFSAGKFRSRLYRPDVVSKILGAGDELEALRLAAPPATATAIAQVKAEDLAEALPPVLELRSESVLLSSASTVPVRLEMRSAAGAPITGLKARVNGRLVRNLNGKGLRDAGVQQIDIPVPPGDAEIVVFAENRYGKSEPTTVKVIRGAEAAKAPALEKFDKLYVLVVGISKYAGDFALEFPQKDAVDFNNSMLKQKGRLYNEVVTRMLVDQMATKAAILDGLQWLRESVGERDAGMLFFAGHGDKVGSSYYFIPGDPTALPSDNVVKTPREMDAWKLKNGPSAWVAGDEISKTLNGIKGRAAFFIDTCHSGQSIKQTRTGSPDATSTLNEINDEKSVIIFASSTSKQSSQEDAKWGNGAFTKAIVEGLAGKADKDNNGLIRPSYLNAYVSDRVRSLTNNEQTPVVFAFGMDDPIAVKTK